MTEKRSKKEASSQIVAQNNELINARFELNLYQIRLFVSVLVRIDRFAQDFSLIEIPVSELVDSNSGSAYDYVRDSCKSFASKYIEIETASESKSEKNKKSYKVIPIVSMCEYVEGAAYVKILLNDQIKPYLLRLRKNFTYTEIQYVRKLKTNYSFRIYWLLKQYQSIGKRKFNVKKFREILKIEDKYPSMSDIRRRVIDPSQKELKKTDLTFEYTLIKKGRKYEEIIFEIQDNINFEEDSEKSPLPQQSWQNLLREMGMEEQSILDIQLQIEQNKIDEAYINYCILRIYEENKVKKIVSIPGMLYKAILEAYWLHDFQNVDCRSKIKNKTDTTHLWRECLKLLSEAISDMEMEIFFEVLDTIEFNYEKLEFLLLATSKSHIEIIEKKYLEVFQKAFRTIFPRGTKLLYTLEPTNVFVTS